MSWSISGSTSHGLHLLLLQLDALWVSSLQHWFCPRKLVSYSMYSTTSAWDLLWVCLLLLRNYVFRTLPTLASLCDSKLLSCSSFCLSVSINVPYSFSEVSTTTLGTHWQLYNWILTYRLYSFVAKSYRLQLLDFAFLPSHLDKTLSKWLNSVFQSPTCKDSNATYLIKCC